MKFTVLNEEELAAQRGTLKSGYCDFEVISAKDKISKSSGNEMIELTLRVWDSEGRQAQLFDYLVSSFQPKIKSFFDSIGAPQTYESGEIDANVIVGATGRAKLGIEKSEQYGDKPKIRDYVKPGVQIEKKKAVNPDDVRQDGDDIPF